MDGMRVFLHWITCNVPFNLGLWGVGGQPGISQTMRNTLSARMTATLGKGVSIPGDKFLRFYTIHKNKSHFYGTKTKAPILLGIITHVKSLLKRNQSSGELRLDLSSRGRPWKRHAASHHPRGVRVLTPSAPVGICPLTLSVRKGEWVDKRLSHSLGRGSGTDSMKFFFNSLMLAWCFFISSWVLSRS